MSASIPIIDLTPEYVDAWSIAELICHGCRQTMTPPSLLFTDKSKTHDVAVMIHDQVGVVCPERKFQIVLEQVMIDKRLAAAEPQGTGKLH